MTEFESPGLGSHTPDSNGAAVESIACSESKLASKPSSTSPPPAPAPTIPLPKTDKPRPHVCQTCMRSFARLEHLKRHERSHTKEKPFECPSCTRCFARRDLLLRHQQKLHSTTTPSSKPRNGRRESTTGVTGGRVRKNSVVNAPSAHMRPRANTVSHIDVTGISMGGTSGQFGKQFAAVHSHHNNFGAMSAGAGLGFRGAGMPAGTTPSGLPRLETHGLSTDMSSGLRTAPPFGGFGAEFDMAGFETGHDNSTINPHALHMHNMSAFPLDGSWNSSQQMFSGLPTSHTMMDDDGFDWVTHGFENQMNFGGVNENAIDDSSPSVMSTNSPAHANEMNQANGATFEHRFGAGGPVWQQQVSRPSQMMSSPISMDASTFFTEMGAPTLGETVSPKSTLAQKAATFEHNFPTPPEMTTLDPNTIGTVPNNTFLLPYQQDRLRSSTGSAESSIPQSSGSTTGSDLVTEHMRSVLITSLNQNSAFSQRRKSQPAVSSPLSPSGAAKSPGFTPATFPTTAELQRYVAGYIKWMQPHLPFLHIPTLNFESVEYQLPKAQDAHSQNLLSGLSMGGSCLLLSMTALGALYEDEIVHSRDLFECAKRLLATYLEECRRSSSGIAPYMPHQRSAQEDTPLWLVQAMLLNVIYGHNCGDKQAADAASNHCAALVSLARSADLAKPYVNLTSAEVGMNHHNIHHMQAGTGPRRMSHHGTTDRDWHDWKGAEERKRTLYAIFILSSLLVTAYNRAPALTNSEIRLDLPCEEELWCAENAQSWRNLGGAAVSDANSVQFASALTHLLTSAQRERNGITQHVPGQPWQSQHSALRPSSLGCLVLIHALHNYIWETRQRHLGRQWTPPEIESMHAHIEPALRAWQAAWNSNPLHAVERPNPFGAGPLSADSIPLLDLAYVRLFVDFGRSKEAYWQRDYDAMAKELAKSSDAEQDAILLKTGFGGQPDRSLDIVPFGYQISGNIEENTKSDDPQTMGEHSQRERHLRKAAFYAADHLIACDRLGTSLGDAGARELPIQSVLCACDSAQVLAEWVATVQERVGKYVGVIGRDHVDLAHVPAILLLDDEDRKLLSMIEAFLAGIESKRNYGPMLLEAREGGYGSRILSLTSEGMARGAVWPVTKLMAQSLETQAAHVKARALASIKDQDLMDST